MILTEPLRSQRLVYRTLNSSALSPNYVRWMCDPTVTRFLEKREINIDHNTFLENYVNLCNESLDLLLVGIYDNDSNRHIGNIKLGPISRQHSRSSLGFLIGDTENWSKGYATEAIVTMSNYAFEILKLAKVTAGCYRANEGSRRCLIKSGFKIEGELREHVSFEDRREDIIVFAKFSPCR